MWHPPSESMLLSAVGGMTDTLHRPSGHLVSKDSLHAVCTYDKSPQSQAATPPSHTPGALAGRPPALEGGARGAARGAHHGLAPEAAPVLQAQHAAAGLVAHCALGAHGQVSFQPLVRHGDLQAERRHTLPQRPAGHGGPGRMPLDGLPRGTAPHTGGGKARSARRCPPTAPARDWRRSSCGGPERRGSRSKPGGGELSTGRRGRESQWSP